MAVRPHRRAATDAEVHEGVVTTAWILARTEDLTRELNEVLARLPEALANLDVDSSEQESE